MGETVVALTISDRVWLRTLKADLLDFDRWPDEDAAREFAQSVGDDADGYSNSLRCRDEITKLVALVERLAGTRL